jgi:uncharacterized protein with HXXEE motif
VTVPVRQTAPDSLIWGVPGAVLMHNVEEALTIARYAPSALALLPDATRRSMPSLEYMYVYVALLVATAIPIGLALLARRRASGGWATYGLLLVAAVMLVNVVWHLAVALAVRGYAPGVVTAVVVNLPVMALGLRWARRGAWLSKGALWLNIATGVMLHGAGLLALLAFVSFSG